jgi:hypothetical protein
MKAKDTGDLADAAGSRTRYDVRALQVLARRLHERAGASTPREEDLTTTIRDLAAEITQDGANALPDRLRHWQNEVHDLTACFLAHLVACPDQVPPQYRLSALRSVFLQPAGVINRELAQISTGSPSQLARNLALRLLRFETHAELEAIRISAASQTYWLSAVGDGRIAPEE